VTLPKEPNTGKEESSAWGDCPPSPDADFTLARLNDQICWYDKEAGHNNLGHKTLRVASLSAAAAIPVLTALSVSPIAAAALGAGIVAVEGIQELFQFQRNWVAFGATREALKHEKFLYLAAAGSYARSQDPHRLLAERLEALVGQETVAWASTEQASDEAPNRPPDRL